MFSFLRLSGRSLPLQATPPYLGNKARHRLFCCNGFNARAHADHEKGAELKLAAGAWFRHTIYSTFRSILNIHARVRGSTPPLFASSVKNQECPLILNFPSFVLVCVGCVCVCLCKGCALQIQCVSVWRGARSTVGSVRLVRRVLRQPRFRYLIRSRADIPGQRPGLQSQDRRQGFRDLPGRCHLPGQGLQGLPDRRNLAGCCASGCR